ncbi:MAG: putative DNA base hypermodification protein [Acidobacteria bacterium]|nr:putative DNA base hypermodification protein [Acidobacteriota bacterium]
MTTAIRRSQPRPSKLYPVLWRFTAVRQRIYLRRLAGETGPWTDDPVLSAYRFTNTFRDASLGVRDRPRLLERVQPDNRGCTVRIDPFDVDADR